MWSSIHCSSASTLRAHAGQAEHSETTGLRDLDDHVAAMREGEDRRLDPEHLTQAVGHGCHSE
jgi:hypothetical protein